MHQILREREGGGEGGVCADGCGCTESSSHQDYEEALHQVEDVRHENLLGGRKLFTLGQRLYGRHLRTRGATGHAVRQRPARQKSIQS